jgi:hypothetical protein
MTSDARTQTLQTTCLAAADAIRDVNALVSRLHLVCLRNGTAPGE